jgi:hypothetical protein
MPFIVYVLHYTSIASSNVSKDKQTAKENVEAEEHKTINKIF